VCDILAIGLCSASHAGKNGEDLSVTGRSEGRDTDLTGFACKRCGRCCARFALDIYEADVERWCAEGREDILEWVQVMQFGDVFVGYEFPINPQTGEPPVRGICHFRQKVRGMDEYICCIYETRPLVCRGYPYNKEYAERTGCPGFGSE
jgi:Fe-S-cluster containining protein